MPNNDKCIISITCFGNTIDTKKPKWLKEVITLTQSTGFDLQRLNECLLVLLTNLRQTSCFSKLLSIIESSFFRILDGREFTLLTIGPWISLTRGDLWVNSIFFHKDRYQNVDDVKLIDFQIYLYNSPLRDVFHILCGNLKDETLINHVEEVFDTYYHKLITNLNR